jgi:hypothetical protein
VRAILLYCALNDGRGFRVAFCKDGVQLLLANVLAVLVTKRIFIILPQDLFHLVEHAAEGAFARLVADEALLILDLEVVVVDFDAWQGFRAVCGERALVFPVCHRVLSLESSFSSVAPGASMSGIDVRYVRVPLR